MLPVFFNQITFSSPFLLWCSGEKIVDDRHHRAWAVFCPCRLAQTTTGYWAVFWPCRSAQTNTRYWAEWAVFCPCRSTPTTTGHGQCSVPACRPRPPPGIGQCSGPTGRPRPPPGIGQCSGPAGRPQPPPGIGQCSAPAGRHWLAPTTTGYWAMFCLCRSPLVGPDHHRVLGNVCSCRSPLVGPDHHWILDNVLPLPVGTGWPRPPPDIGQCSAPASRHWSAPTTTGYWAMFCPCRSPLVGPDHHRVLGNVLPLPVSTGIRHDL
jgi:hypothetical protein